MEDNDQVLIIAEAGVNHNGCLQSAFELVNAAKESGADIVKFQLFNADDLVQKDAPMAKYQSNNIGDNISQYEMLKSLELTFEEHVSLSKYCKTIGIEYLSTAFDDRSLNFLDNQIDQKRYKIPSGEITNGPFLAKHAQLSKPLILSTGMATLAEVEMALAVINYVYKTKNVRPTSLQEIMLEFVSNDNQAELKEKITLLHCSSEYPASLETVNLRSMPTMGKVFSLKYGYSDHTEGLEIAVAAATLGAGIVEKHFTLDKSAKGPDHAASITPDELKLMVSSIRNVEKAMGNENKRPSLSELETAKIARKSLIAAENISAGEKFTEKNLGAMRPGTGVSPMSYWGLIKKSAKRDYYKGEIIDE